MGSCPACIAMPLTGYEASPGVQVELCATCRGLFVDRQEVRSIVGAGSLAKATEVVPISLGRELGMRCPKCVQPVMQPLRVRGAKDVRSWQCRSCGGLWLEEGAFFELSRAIRDTRPTARHPLPGFQANAGGTSRGGLDLAHSRSHYDRGIANLIAVPLVMCLSWALCSTNLGALFASLVGMPFHELGHAVASWLSSRIAIPLPFFTFWYDDQSAVMGLLVVTVLGWLMFHTLREKNHFMLGVTGSVLVLWGIATFLVSSSTTLMWQIIAGALGEVVLGGFLLVAFHFPLPDRFRWDFWRWIAVVPAALCFVHALMLWHRVAADVTQMPWGSAIGAESDGDMNRLVQQFAWDANELARLYLYTAYGCLVLLAAAYSYAAIRMRDRLAPGTR